MLNHTYTSVKNANLVDCGKKQHISSQPSPLLKDNFLGEFRTELDKKKVLANLGIATSLSLEWEYIQGDIGRSQALMQELDSRTKYISDLDGFQKSVIEGIKYLESVVGSELDVENAQDNRLSALETSTQGLIISINELKAYLKDTIEIDINTLETSLNLITEKVNNITELIQVSNKEGNALKLLGVDEVAEGETPGLYVPDLSKEVSEATSNISTLQSNVSTINQSLDSFVTKEALGGGNFDFIKRDEFSSYTNTTNSTISGIQQELTRTVKTGEDGHVDTLYVNTISKDNDDSNIKLTDSFEVTSGIPLDIRCVVENLEELKALPVKVCYAGMGVIVNSISSLYILRKPAEGVAFNQDYISNIYNWKCPEDLVTVALTRSEYDSLEEINPNVFYYVYEDEITRTQEPKRDEYDSDEAFNEAFQDWVDSLKVLSQEYMSASWGVEIENKLAKKASSLSVNLLSQEIANLKGGDGGLSLSTLSESVTELQKADESINEQLGVLETNISSVGESVLGLETNLAENYVTKDALQDASQDFIFVKTETYNQDKESFLESLANNVTTESVNTNTINTTTVLVGNVSLTSDEYGNLCENSKPLAKEEDIPVIKVIPQSEYDNLEEIEENTYYYTFDGTEVYVTQTELSSKFKMLQDQIASLTSKLSELTSEVELLKAQHNTEEQD